MHTEQQMVSLRLMEYLLARLRVRVQALESTAKAARENELQVAQVLRMGMPVVRDLCGETAFDAAFTKLLTYLQDAFSADLKNLYVYTANSIDCPIPGIRICTPADPTRRTFLALIEHMMPLCDSLQDEHLMLLLGHRRLAMRSTLLVPMRGATWDALLLLASQAPDRYRHGPRLDFLLSLTTVLARATDDYLKAASRLTTAVERQGLADHDRRSGSNADAGQLNP